MSSAPRRVLAAIGLVLVASALAAGTGAGFTATSANPANEIVAGVVQLSSEDEGRSVLKVAGLAPGRTTSVTTELRHEGDIEAILAVARGPIANTPATPSLSAVLDLRIEDLGDPSCQTDCPAARTLHEGKLGAMGTVTVGALEPGARRRVRFRVGFPDGGHGADNAYQGASTSVDLDWSLTQR